MANQLVTLVEHRVCRQCKPPHVDNCQTCFGWGLSKSGRIIAASEVSDMQETPDDVQVCPECGGNPVNAHLSEV